MTIKMGVAAVLIVLGLFGLGYGGLSFTHQKKVVDLGPVEVSKTEHESLPVPPLVGGLLLASGIVLLVTGRRAGV